MTLWDMTTYVRLREERVTRIAAATGWHRAMVYARASQVQRSQAGEMEMVEALEILEREVSGPAQQMTLGV